MRLFYLALVVVLIGFAGCAQVAFADQFRFQDLEHYYLHDYLPRNSDDITQSLLNDHAVQHTEEHFPIGSSASVGVSESRFASVKCSVDDNSNDSPGFVCDWSRPDYGLDHICCQIDFIIARDTDKNYKKIQKMEASRTESGP